MKKLKKILLINWLYFSKQLIEVDDINFLTGKNGAGKSTVIDALQIVFLGELNARNFNKAANESSQRTLDGYLRADMDPSSTKSRRGKDFSSYIACEFCDEQEGKQFVTGIVFDCHSDGSKQNRFFIYDGTIPESCYLVNRRAMSISDLRTYFKAIPNAHFKFYETGPQYRRDMLAKWNVHSDQVCRMMKKAVSFKPIVDIQQFITENICDIPKRPDIESMQQNIRDYKRHEQLAQRQEEKLTALTEINRLFREMNSAIDRMQQQSFLILWAEKVQAENQILKLEVEKEDCQQGIAQAADDYQRLSDEIAQKTKRKEELIADRATSNVFQEKNRLEAEKAHLEQERNRLAALLNNTALEIKKEAQVLCSVCKSIADWTYDCSLASLVQAASNMVEAYGALCQCTSDSFRNALSHFETAQQATAQFSKCLRDAAYHVETHLADVEGNIDSAEAVLSNLRRNVKPYPKGLLDLKKRIEDYLSQKSTPRVSVEILADVLEIADGQDSWRGAVEGYLNTQKFYLLVSPEFYRDALTLYDRIKHDYPQQSFGLVDIGKLREKGFAPAWDDSLAKKVDTSNPLARDYIDYLLGHVVCCTHVQQLRKHKTAITADGMVYSGYVARPIPKDRMEDTFIGKKAVELRIARIESDIQGFKVEQQRWLPIHNQLNKEKNREFLFTQRFVQDELVQRQADYLRGLEILQRIDKIVDQISHLDLFWVAKLDEQINALEKEVKELEGKRTQCSEQKGKLEARVYELEYDKLPDVYQILTSREDRISEEFSATFCDTVGIPRYNQELSRLKKPEIILRNFRDGGAFAQAQKDADTSRSRLFQARRKYADDFKPCSFRVEVMDNDEYDAERHLLAESELPQYREKIKKARESALEQFQNDFLAKLGSSIEQVQEQVKNLNKALRQAQFGTDRYQFCVGSNPDYADYYNMIMAPENREGEGGIFALAFQEKYGALIDDLFGRITVSDDTQLNARKQSELQQNIDLYTDYRTYLKFDLETTDQNGNKQLLSQTLNTKSGGETQTPFYIAVLASFAQLYQVNNLSGIANNTVRLVVFDEAFNKMDSDRIIESVRLLRKMHLQAIICTPPDKLPDIGPLADKTLLVRKDKYNMNVLTWSKETESVWNEE